MRGQYRTTLLIYIALLLGQIAFCLFTVFFITLPGRPLASDHIQYPYAGILAIFLAAGAAWYVNQLREKSVVALKANFAGKLLHYQTTVIFRAAMIQVGNLFCLFLAILENSLSPLVYFCLGLLIYLYFKPNTSELVRVYQLTSAEKREIEKQAGK